MGNTERRLHSFLSLDEIDGVYVGKFRNPTAENPDNMDPVYRDSFGRLLNHHACVVKGKRVIDVGGVNERDVIKD